MQISRHWRLNAQRYRLEGFRNSNGEVSLQPRHNLTKPEGSSVLEGNHSDEETSIPIENSGSPERRAG